MHVPGLGPIPPFELSRLIIGHDQDDPIIWMVLIYWEHNIQLIKKKEEAQNTSTAEINSISSTSLESSLME